ncbi:bcl-2-like protein 10 isoform X1 [Heterocephalus glaber]|uniref:Bcl-2-like protein 10 isoform X1 n=1 Tax=Heterocephalus glaber TaxID=10181 RepID=A0AAX6T5G3_HETGA|nr:bcl-2-like protein 10 isoform X1 [Heterocephalus glaber]
MGDPLWTRTEQLFADYLQFCARDPGTNGLPPRTPEAALLRTAAQELLRGHGRYFARYRDYGGNRAELLEMLADAIVPDDCKPTWLRVVTLATLAGTLLEHPGSSGREKVARDCRRMVARLCARFVGRHRAWLEAQGDWCPAVGMWPGRPDKWPFSEPGENPQALQTCRRNPAAALREDHPDQLGESHFWCLCSLTMAWPKSQHDQQRNRNLSMQDSLKSASLKPKSFI